MGASAEGKPLWQLLADLTPEQFVARVDFRYITDALDPGRGAASCCEERAAGKAERLAELRARRLPAYTTSAGWLGYPDEKVRAAAPARRSPRAGRT